MKKAAWLSRHHPTHEQLVEIVKLGYTITDLESGMANGSIEIKDRADVQRILKTAVDSKIVNGKEVNNEAIFGVPSVPVLEAMAGNTTGIPFFAAWNIQRSVEGQKPTFTHKCWVKIGWI